jgi:hypothetical protein
MALFDDRTGLGGLRFRFLLESELARLVGITTPAVMGQKTVAVPIAKRLNSWARALPEEMAKAVATRAVERVRSAPLPWARRSFDEQALGEYVWTRLRAAAPEEDAENLVNVLLDQPQADLEEALQDDESSLAHVSTIREGFGTLSVVLKLEQNGAMARQVTSKNEPAPSGPYRAEGAG